MALCLKSATLAASLAAGTVLCGAASVKGQDAQSAPLAQAELSSGFAAAEVTEASRSDGVLTVRVRFAPIEGAAASRSSARETVYSSIGPGSYRQDFYVLAGENRHLLLADTEGTPLTVPNLSISREGDTVRGTWWGKFPAPEPSIREFSLALPGGLLFDNVPISDE